MLTNMSTMLRTLCNKYSRDKQITLCKKSQLVIFTGRSVVILNGISVGWQKQLNSVKFVSIAIWFKPFELFMRKIDMVNMTWIEQFFHMLILTIISSGYRISWGVECCHSSGHGFASSSSATSPSFSTPIFCNCEISIVWKSDRIYFYQLIMF